MPPQNCLLVVFQELRWSCFWPCCDSCLACVCAGRLCEAIDFWPKFRPHQWLGAKHRQPAVQPHRWTGPTRDPAADSLVWHTRYTVCFQFGLFTVGRLKLTFLVLLVRSIIDVSAVVSQGLEQREYMDRARQYRCVTLLKCHWCQWCDVVNTGCNVSFYLQHQDFSLKFIWV